jgi:hypothetical protein
LRWNPFLPPWLLLPLYTLKTSVNTVICLTEQYAQFWNLTPFRNKIVNENWLLNYRTSTWWNLSMVISLPCYKVIFRPKAKKVLTETDPYRVRSLHLFKTFEFIWVQLSFKVLFCLSVMVQIKRKHCTKVTSGINRKRLQY